jgi:16S rRNA (guanine1207-N2)-methyltransferase
MKSLTEAMDALVHIVGLIESEEPVTGKVLAVNVIADPALEAWREQMTLVHWHRGAAKALEEQGFKVNREEAVAGGRYAEVWVLPDRQRESQLGDVAKAWDQVDEGGRLIVSVRNDWGAKRLEDQWREIVGVTVETHSKHHCRVFVARKRAGAWNEARVAAWREGAAMRRMPETGYWSRPGLFSWQGADVGSRILAVELPKTLEGDGADLGAGWGWLSMEVLKRCPEIRSLDAFEVDARAIEPARRNLGNVLVPVRPKLFWKDVTTGVGRAVYDFVVMNPPFHEGRDAEHGLGLKFITAAAAALKHEGELWMVANKQLPYEVLLEDLFAQVTMVTQRDGFKVLHAVGVNSKVHAAAGRSGGQRRGRGRGR